MGQPLLTSRKDRSLLSANHAGMINNLNDGMVWDLVRIFLAAAAYPGVWRLSQLVTGALSDRLGRKWMIVARIWAQALGIWVIVAGKSMGG
jgi:MFS family permease